MGSSWSDLQLLAPRRRSRAVHRWYPLYSSDVEYSVEVELPRGDTLDRRVFATDAEEAARIVCEELMDDEGVEFDVAWRWISPAQRVRRGA